MWPPAPAHVTAPQAAVEELHLEGAPKPGCRGGLQLRAAPRGQLSSASSQWHSLLPSAHWGAGKVRSSSVQTALGSVPGKQHSHGTWQAGGRWRNKGKRGQWNMWKTCDHWHDTAAVPTPLCECTTYKWTFRAGAGRLKGRFTNRNLSLACDTGTTFYALWVKHLQECPLLLVKSTTGRARKDVVVAKCRTQHCPEECNDKNWKSELPKINCLCLRAGTAKRGTLQSWFCYYRGTKKL